MIKVGTVLNALGADIALVSAILRFPAIALLPASDGTEHRSSDLEHGRERKSNK